VPETTETTVLDRDRTEVFRYLADFGNLADWDPSFDSSERLDSGPLGEGSRFKATLEMLGNEVEIDFVCSVYDEPNRVVLDGTSDRFTTQEDIRVGTADDGRTEVSYTGSFDTEAPDLLDAATKPGFFFVGKAAIRGMQRTLGDDES
jgi:hypothetical protein